MIRSDVGNIFIEPVRSPERKIKKLNKRRSRSPRTGERRTGQTRILAARDKTLIKLVIARVCEGARRAGPSTLVDGIKRVENIEGGGSNIETHLFLPSSHLRLLFLSFVDQLSLARPASAFYIYFTLYIDIHKS